MFVESLRLEGLRAVAMEAEHLSPERGRLNVQIAVFTVHTSAPPAPCGARFGLACPLARSESDRGGRVSAAVTRQTRDSGTRSDTGAERSEINQKMAVKQYVTHLVPEPVGATLRSGLAAENMTPPLT